MSAWVGYFPVAGRLALAAALAASALALLAGALRGRKARRRAAQPPRPGRRGLAELTALIERARRRPYSRDLAAERLRALARDLVALRLGSGDVAARAALDEATAGAALEATRAEQGATHEAIHMAAAEGAWIEAGAAGPGGRAKAVGLDTRLLDFLAEDHFAKPGPRPSFGLRARRGKADREVTGDDESGGTSYLERLDEALRLLEAYGEDLQGERQ